MYCMCIHRGAFNCILFFCMDVLSKDNILYSRNRYESIDLSLF